MRKLIAAAAAVLALAACGGDNQQELHDFDEECARAGGHALQVMDFDGWHSYYYCFDVERILLDDAQLHE